MSEGIKIYVADIETTGLLNGLLEQGSKAKLHNLAVMDVLTPENGVKVFHAGNDLQEFLSKPAYFIMHNGIGYDKEALEILGYDTSNITFIDTLALSYYLYLDRDKHGLESWGEEFGVPKPEIKDWESLTQADYDHRVTEDVKINYTLYQKMFNDLAEVYVDEIKSDDDFVNHRLVKYLNFKVVQLAEQASTKTKIDVKLAVSEIARFEKEIEEKNEALKLKMPKVEKIAKRKPPANPFKRNGELSVTGERWKELTESVGVPFEFDGQIDVVVGYDEPNPNSSDQLKKWLFSLGWKPETLKYVKDKETGKERTIPQLYIPKSGGKLCPSIEKLVRVHPQLEELEGKSILVHRKGVCQGFVDSLVKLDGQGEAEYVEASAGGFTNTLRLKHRKPLVNLPSVNAKEAENVRACLMAKEGNAFFGADLSGLETILKFNFMLPHDPDFVYEQMKPDYDPHLDIAVSAEMMTQSQCDFYKIVDKGEDEEQYEKTVELVEMLNLSDNDKKRLIKDLGIIRHSAKQSNYSCQYGAGYKAVARSADIENKIAKKLVEGYRAKNWSIQKIADEQYVKECSTGKWLWNPLTKLYYRLVSDKDRFSTLIQGTGSYMLDMWVGYSFHIRKKEGLEFKQNATFHDEKVWEFVDSEEMREKIVSCSNRALDMLNKQFKLEIPIKASHDFGKRYSEIH